MNIKFTTRNLEAVQKFIKDIPRGAKIAVMEAFSEYIVGDENHGLKYEPPQVTHDASNPYQWTSEKQRKAFFATDGFGRGIPTVRTHDGVNSWTVTKKDSNWTQVKIEGGNKFVQGEQQQRGHAADGWRKYADIVTDNMAGAMRHARARLGQWLRERAKK